VWHAQANSAAIVVLIVVMLTFSNRETYYMVLKVYSVLYYIYVIQYSTLYTFSTI